MSDPDQPLLQRFVRDGDRDALDELIRRNLDFVYSAALRHVRDPHLAEDVTQAVFLILVQKARAIRSSTVIAGWLFNTTRYASANAMKTRNRRQHHERSAARSRSAQDNAAATEREAAQNWERISPALDDAMSRLGKTDRDALLLRFLRGQAFGDVGVALGVSEEAARKRVARSLERLRSHLARAGVVLTAGEMSAAIVGHATTQAPHHLLAAATALGSTVGGGSTAASAIAAAAARWMRWVQVKVAASMVGGSVVAVAVGTGLIRHAFAADHAGPPHAVVVAADAPAAPTPAAPTTVPTTEPAPATAPVPEARADEIQHRVQCSSQMRRLGQLLYVYSQRHGGKFPDDLSAVVAANRVDLQWFLCPSAGQQPPVDAARMTPAQRAGWVTVHTDYIYVGKGQTNHAPAERILMYEKPGAHGGDGMNMLYADGHVEFQLPATAKRDIEAQERLDKKGEEGL